MLHDRCFNRALLLNGHKIPAKRKEELEDIVKSYYGLNNVSEEALKMAMDIDPRYVSLVFLFTSYACGSGLWGTILYSYYSY
jgi:hypothetical protein